MKLVVGLGNPGSRYAGTRHNVGFELAAELGRRFGVGSVKSRFEGELLEAQIDTEKVWILCPGTYMNASGRSVRGAVDYFKLGLEDLLVVCDDFNLETARLRFRAKGSAGGQKGLDDIIRCLGSQDFARLRIGIGAPPPRWEVRDYVLSKFRAEERKLVDVAVALGADGAADWCRHGIAYCMNKYNAGPSEGG